MERPQWRFKHKFQKRIQMGFTKIRLKCVYTAKILRLLSVNTEKKTKTYECLHLKTIWFLSDPTGTRTQVTRLKTSCPRPLDDGALKIL